MKEQIDYWVDEAFTVDDNPNKAIKKIAEKYDLNPDKLQRVVEGYNVRSFLDRKKRGDDLEKSFPIANPVKIAASILKKEVKGYLPKESSDKQEVDFSLHPNDISLGEQYHTPIKSYRSKPLEVKEASDLREDFEEVREYIQRFKKFSHEKKVALVKKSNDFYIHPEERNEFTRVKSLINKIAAKKKKSPVKEPPKPFLENSFNQDAKWFTDLLNKSKIRRDVMGLPTEEEDKYDPTLFKILNNMNPLAEEKGMLSGVNDLFDINKRKIEIGNLEKKYTGSIIDTINVLKEKALVENLINDPMFKDKDTSTILDIYQDAHAIAPKLMETPGSAKKAISGILSMVTPDTPYTGLDYDTIYTMQRIEDKIWSLLNKDTDTKAIMNLIDRRSKKED